MYLCPTVNNLILNNNFDKYIVDVFMAFYIGMVVVYLLIIKPLYIDRKMAGDGVGKMMSEYYTKDNIIKVLGMDIIFILLYFIVAYMIYQKFHDKLPTEYHSIKFILILILTIILIDILLGIYIKSVPFDSPNLTFFRKWGSTAGYNAVIFDIILVVIIGIIALLLDKFQLNSKWHLLILLVVILGYFFSV